MIKLSLGHCWFTAEIFLQLTCSSKINYFLLCAWISEILKYLMKSLETFHKLSLQYSLLKKLSLELALHTMPNGKVLMITLSLGHCWFTAEMFLQLTCSSKINYFLLCAWISEILKYLMKSLETFHKWPIEYSLLKKLSLELAPMMLMLFPKSPRFHLYSFQGPSLY